MEWHLKLAHAQPRTIQIMAKSNLLQDMPPELKQPPPKITRSACAVAKQPQLTFHRKPENKYQRSEHLSSDICGPISPLSMDQNTYFITFVNDKTRRSQIRSMKRRSETSSITKDIITLTNNQRNIAIKRITTDNAKEYYSTSMRQFYKKH